MLTRRAVSLGAAALAACAHGSREADATQRIEAIETRLGVRIGVAALNTETGAWIATRRHERFAMASTFKWLLAAQMLSMDMHTPGFREQQVRFSERDLLDYAPAARANLARGWMSVEELCEAIVVVSDNAAANLLLTAAGGPEGFTSFLRANGDAVTRLDRMEPELNENAEGDERDTTSPEAMALTLKRFLVDDGVLNLASRERLIGWMVACATGHRRLRAGFPSTWRFGDKTGSGMRGAVNDVAIGWPPGKAAIVIASYMSGGDANTPAREAAHAEIGRVIAETWGS